MRHALGWIVVGMLLGTVTSGCGPEVPQSEMGTIVYEVPTVAGADEPYRLPELSPSAMDSVLRSQMPATTPDGPKPTPPSQPTK
jgi:hypothetical protein